MPEQLEISGLPKTCEGPVFYSPSGDKIREFFVWNADMTELEKVGEEDIQEAMDERAKGMTIPEQVARLARGDTSMLKDGEGFYGDVYEYPETTGEALKALGGNLEQLQDLEEKQKKEAKASLDEKIANLEKELAEFKAQKEKAYAPQGEVNQ